MKHKILSLVLLGLLCSIGNVWGETATFSGENLNVPDNPRTISSITLSTSDMTYSGGLYASGSNKSFTLSASEATISQVLITMSSGNNRYKSENITNCTSCTRDGSVYTCIISPAVAVVTCKNNGGAVTITQIDVTYATSSGGGGSSYTVTYKSGEGSGDDVVVSPATTIAGCPNTFSAPSNKAFAGWKDEDGTPYSVGDDVEEDLTLIAQWERNPEFSIGATASTSETFLKEYSTEAITLGSTSSYSSGAVQLGTTPSDYNSHYFQIEASSAVKKISVLMSGNGDNKKLRAPAFGWASSPSSNTADTYFLPDEQTSSANSYASAVWFDYDFSASNIKYIRLYRATKNISSINPEYTGSSTALGNGQTIKIYGIKVWLKPVSATTLEGRSYATMVTPEGLGLDFGGTVGVTAYITSDIDPSDGSITITPIDIVPGGTPIIIKTDVSGATVNVPYTTSEASSTIGNLLVAGDGETAWNGTAGYTYYYLASDAFHKAIDGTLQSGKAYLKVEGDPAGAPSLRIVEGEQNATDIQSIESADKAVKFIENDRILIMKNGIIYDALGRVIR